MDFGRIFDREHKADETKEQTFDKKDEYMQDVVPLLEKLKETCDKHGLPYLFWVVFEEDENHVGQGILMNSRGQSKMMLCGNVADGTFSLDMIASAFKMYEAFNGIERRAGK